MCPSKQQRGFTLVEVIVVIVIMGVLVGMSTLSLSGRGQQDGVRDDAERLRAVISVLQDEAIIQSREYGLQAFDRGYRFFLMDDKQRWLLITEDKVFRPFVFSAGVTAQLTLDGLVTPLEELGEEGFPEIEQPSEGAVIEASSLPSIFVLSSGEMSTFEILLKSDFSDVCYKISGNLVGQLSLDYGHEEL